MPKKLKIPERFFAEFVVVLRGQADGPLIYLKWEHGKLVVVHGPPQPDPRFHELANAFAVLTAAGAMEPEVSTQIAGVLQPVIEQHLYGALKGLR